MPVISWREDFATGDSAIDSQHRALCKMFCDLHETLSEKRDSEVAIQLLEVLERYLVRHFAVERQMMESSGFPAMALHLAQHEELVKKCREIRSGVHSGRVALGTSLVHFVARWLAEHIVVEDKKMVQWSRLNHGFAANSGQFPTRDSGPCRTCMPAEESRCASGTLAADVPGKWTARDSMRQLVAAQAARSKR